ncbi:MAG: FtsX-like permease family protein [Desulfobulbaceae bacterium]|nr:FtsX-like permease family protein [Desulfobulbaceae bacterium]
MTGKGLDSILTTAWKTVYRKVFRNIVLALAVSLLVSLLVFALLFNRAVQDDIDAASRKLGADIVMVPAEAIEMAEEFILESKKKGFYMDKDVYEKVKTLPEIKAATYQIYLETLESGCCSIVAGQVIAFDPETDFVVSPWFSKTPPPLGESEVYIGSYVYEYLGLIDTPTLFNHKVKVVGDIEETGTGLDHGLFMRVEDLNKITEQVVGKYKPGDISIIFLKLKEGVDFDALINKLSIMFPNIGIMTPGSIGADVRSTLEDITKVFSITIIISSVLAVLLAWSTFTALANERQREVGILRAIGAHKSHIMKMFLSEAAIISLIGGVLGVGIGNYLIHNLAGNFDLLSKLGAYASFSPLNVLFSVVAMLVGISVCLIGAAIPVIRLARLEPLVAIKED